MFSQHEIIETIKMIESEHLDVRTITMGISLRDCAMRMPKDPAIKSRKK